MNAPVIYINNLSSAVAVELKLYDSEQNLLDPASVPFKFVYVDRKKTRYEVIHHPSTNGQPEYFKNCFLKDERMFIRFENTEFVTGVHLNANCG